MLSNFTVTGGYQPFESDVSRNESEPLKEKRLQEKEQNERRNE